MNVKLCVFCLDVCVCVCVYVGVVDTETWDIRFKLPQRGQRGKLAELLPPLLTHKVTAALGGGGARLQAYQVTNYLPVLLFAGAGHQTCISSYDIKILKAPCASRFTGSLSQITFTASGMKRKCVDWWEKDVHWVSTYVTQPYRVDEMLNPQDAQWMR